MCKNVPKICVPSMYFTLFKPSMYDPTHNPLQVTRCPLLGRSGPFLTLQYSTNLFPTILLSCSTPGRVATFSMPNLILILIIRPQLIIKPKV